MIFFKIRIKSFNVKDIYFPNNENFIFIKLKRKIDKITVLRSPHIYKKAREQFQINIYKRAVYIYNFIKEDIFLSILRDYLNKNTLDVQCVSVALKRNNFEIQKQNIKYLPEINFSRKFILRLLTTPIRKFK